MIHALAAGFRLSLRHARYARGQTAVLVLCVCATLLPPLAARVIVREYEAALRARAAATPLVVGARGSRFDLTMALLHFRRAGIDPLSVEEYRAIHDSGLAVAVPVNARSTARGFPIAATSHEYYEQRNLRPARGTLPIMLGEAVLGAAVAKSTGLGPGDHIFSDPVELYDISRPAALKMRIAGVLAPTGSPDDDAVFTDIKTAWIIEGFAHGHEPPSKVAPSLIDAATPSPSGGHATISEALIDYNEVTPDTASTFHVHGDEGTLPLTGVLVFPFDDKSATILRGRINAGMAANGSGLAVGNAQALEPSEVVEEVLRAVLRVRRLVDALAVALGLATVLLMILVGVLSARLRAREMETLRRIGCPPGTTAAMHVCEFGLVLVAGVATAIGLAAAAAPLWPLLSRLVQGS